MDYKNLKTSTNGLSVREEFLTTNYLIECLSIFNIISEQKGNGRDGTILNLLTPYLNNDLFIWLLDIAFNPFKITKIKSLPKTSVTIENPVEKLVLFINDVVLSNRGLTNKQKEYISELVYSIPQYNILLEKIITKQLNIGLSTKLVNKAIGYDLIFVDELMLAKQNKNDDIAKHLNSYPYLYAELKYDGARIAYLEDKDNFYSRNFKVADKKYLSKQYADIKTFTQRLKELLNSDENLFIDFELISPDKNRLDSNGILNSIIRDSKTKLKDSPQDKLIMCIFDFDLCKVINDKVNSTYNYEFKRGILDKIKVSDLSMLIIGEYWIVKNYQEINNKFDDVVKKGEEGLIIKTPYHFYTPKRSKDWIKLKQENDIDLLVEDVFYGSENSKREGLVAGVIVRDGSGQINQKIGTGLTDKQIQELTNNPESIINKIITIKYSEIQISTKNNSPFLFLPTLKNYKIREDKNKPDTIN